MSVLFSLSCTLLIENNVDTGNLTNTHGENRLQLEEEMQELASGKLFQTETATIPVSKLRQHAHHLVKVINVSRPGEEREGEMKMAVEVQNPESLERLWEDYCSGHLNSVAEKYLLTDDIKERFDVESVKIETSILEEDYLSCKEFLLKKPSKLTIKIILDYRQARFYFYSKTLF